MHIILGTEIWGRTPHVVTMAKSLAEIASVTVVDPYDGNAPEFASEEEAYARFLEAGGHDAYAVQMAQALAEADEPTYLLGFSAGAGAIWSAVCGDERGIAKGALCFYGSHIRNLMGLETKVPVEMVFSDKEKHFDVEPVARDLQDKENVQCYLTHFEHGFMNPVYEHFNADVYGFWMDWIKDQFEVMHAQQK